MLQPLGVQDTKGANPQLRYDSPASDGPSRRRAPFMPQYPRRPSVCLSVRLSVCLSWAWIGASIVQSGLPSLLGKTSCALNRLRVGLAYNGLSDTVDDINPALP